MRGGFVACLARHDSTASRVEAAAAELRWHSGRPSLHRHGRLQVACLADDLHGPVVEMSAGRLLLCHGGPAEPLERLEQRERYVGLESDGRTLRAIRDPMGEVPLFYRRAGDELWLATEIHPLLAIAPAEPDLEWVSAFLARAEYPDRTGWSGIERALPGEVLHVDPELRVSSSRYFLPGRPRPDAPSAAAAALRLRELLAVAVETRASGRCGVLLSGGLDSSAVALLAAGTGRPTLLTISYPALPDVDETRYAEAVAEAAGVPLTTLEVAPDPWNPADDIDTYGMPPVGGPTGMYALGLQGLADAGCDTALDGHDGDGALGYRYAWDANTLLDGRVDRLVAAAREYGPRSVVRETARGLVSPPVRGRLQRRPVSPGYLASFLPYFRGATARRLAAESRWRPPRSGWYEMQLQPLLPPMTQHFEEFELLGARAGVDVRHPFASRELIDLLVSLPHRVKASAVRPKQLLRDALADLLPPIVAERDGKTYFTAVLDARVDFDACYRWIRDSGVRLPDLDYGRLFRDAPRPVNDRIFWTRLASAHVFLAGA